MHYIMLDAETVQSLTVNNNKRVICRLNNQLEFHCAIIPQKGRGHYIIVSSAVCKTLNIKAGANISASFSVDHSIYQFDMPDELKEVLDTDPEADKIFHALTAGNQRGLIRLVTQVKSSDIRIERALKIAEQIKNGVTSPRIILK